VRICKIIVAFAISSLLTLSFFVDNAYAHKFSVPYGGHTETITHYGIPQDLIAYYDAGAYELRLGVRCVIYASATATGYMYVCAKATSTGWVTATIKWFIKAHVVSTGVGPHDAYITIDFVLFDKTDKITFTQELLEARGYVAGEWRLDTVDIPLLAGHRYNFYLNATAHAYLLKV